MACSAATVTARPCCVDWLEQDGIRFDADLTHLLRHDEAMVFIADQQRRSEAVQTVQALMGLLQEGGIASTAEWPILLWIACPDNGHKRVPVPPQRITGIRGVAASCP